MTEKKPELTYICSKDGKRKTRTECENCDDFLDCPYFVEEFSEEQQQKTVADAVAASPDVERQHAILELLGFVKSDEKDGVRYRKTVDGVKIARDFFSKNPDGRFWAKQGDEFISDEKLKQLPTVARFYELRDSGKPLPAAVLLGSIAGLSASGKAALIAIDDEYEPEQRIWFGLGAVKTNHGDSRIAENEKFIPSGFTAKSKTGDAKLKLPRPIVLPNFADEMKNAPISQNGNGYHGEESIPEGQPLRGSPKAPQATAAQKKNILNQEESMGENADEANVDEIMRGCLREGVMCVNGVLVAAYPQLTDAEKADFAVRIAISLHIEEGKKRRKERY